ncbi:MAG: ABC transporter permease, partial [Spirochaetaceae bacterium]|nr:ABC transporter permease [Spirochaetaceae bacterium]
MTTLRMTLHMALRNISRQKKRTILLGGAIAFGVMIITLVGSLTAGLASTANERFTDLLGGHIYISGQEVSESGRLISIIGEQEPLEEALFLVDDQIKEIRFRSAASGEIIFGSKTTTLLLDGVDWDHEPTLYENLELIAGDITSVSNERTIIVPEPVMEELGVLVGESVLIRVTSITGQRNVGDFVIGGVTADAGTFGLGSAYVDRAYLNSLIGMNADQYQRANIALADTGDIEAIAATIERELLLLGKIDPAEADAEESSGPGSHMGGGGMMFPGGIGFSAQIEETEQWEGTQFRVSTINDVMEPVMTIVTLLNQASLGLFFVLMTITMVGLLNTFRMILIERTREIG